MTHKKFIEIVYRRTISGKQVSKTLRVLPLPKMRQKIVVDPTTMNIYWHDETRDRWCCVKDGIYSLSRMLTMMLTTHAKELPVIEDIADLTADLQADLSVVVVANSEHSKESILPAIRHASHKLHNVIDRNKLEARWQYHAMLLWKDSKGRVNSGVLMCRNQTAVRRLKARLNAISDMKPWLVFYHASVGELIRQIHKDMESVANRLEKATRLYADMILQETASKQNTGPRIRLRTVVEECVDLLVQLPQVAPHSKATDLMLEDLETVLRGLKKNASTVESEMVQPTLYRSASAMNFRCQRVHIEGILIDLRICMQISSLWTADRQKDLRKRILRIKTACEKIEPTGWQRPASHARCLNSLAQSLAALENSAEPKNVHRILKQAARI